MEQSNREILITGDSLLIDVQRTFSHCYPFLKIEFIQTVKGMLMHKGTQHNPWITFGELATMGISYKIDINRFRTVSELTYDFKSKMDITVQVSRRSGFVWNVISITQGWTLENQNIAGEFISLKMEETGVSD